MVSIEIRDIHLTLARYQPYSDGYDGFKIVFSRAGNVKPVKLTFERYLCSPIMLFLEFLKTSHKFYLCKIVTDNELFYRISDNLLYLMNELIYAPCGLHSSGKIYKDYINYIMITRHPERKIINYTMIHEQLLLNDKLHEMIKFRNP